MNPDDEARRQDHADIWKAIDALTDEIAALRKRLDPDDEQRGEHRRHEPAGRLSAKEVRDMQFATTRLRPGYDEEEVDAFLDRVEAEIATLNIERDRARNEADELRRRMDEDGG